MLTLKNIKKDYRVGDETVNALRGLTVSFRENEFVSVLGPSGCGKTTLMNIIGGLDKSTSGDLFINGKSTLDYTDGDWDNYRNKRIGFIFQSYNLIPHLTVLGNVEIALTISGISKDERRKLAIESLKKVGLEKQLKQKPNQLSGGQMQRVAIARALVNDPEILLADEPTGALDTETSKQIMDLIKEVSNEKLVIMVTHNPELANLYSTRIIKMLDGLILEDNKPFNEEVVINKQDKKTKKVKSKKVKTAMSYLTALSLSWKNLITKKGRTLLTAIAGSIGIIGIALILAFSNGVNNYVERLQTDTLASQPITISESSININELMGMGPNSESLLPDFPLVDKIFAEKTFDISSVMTKNNITKEYIDYIETNLNKEWYSDIKYETGIVFNIYGKRIDGSTYTDISGSMSNWQMMLETPFTLSQYTTLDGEFPKNKNEVVIIVDKKNQVPMKTLEALGLIELGLESKEINFNDIINHEFMLINNNEKYIKENDKYIENNNILFDENKALTVTGILRIQESATSGSLKPGIGYLKELYTDYQEINIDSEIVNFIKDNPMTDPFTGLPFNPQDIIQGRNTSILRNLAGNDIPSEISIYPTNFDTKIEIKKVLDNYNNDQIEEENKITYFDLSQLISETMTTMVNVISYVLIAFTGISLIVSSIMIAIITYVSVLERTKEIGVLRSIGARKKDITRVFNSETIIIGFISGFVGVTFAYLVTIPVNIILKAKLEVENIASLSFLAAVVLVIISVSLTLISGLVPAKKAAKQDPVTALRTE